MNRPKNAHREKECGEKKERTGEDVETRVQSEKSIGQGKGQFDDT